MEPLNRELLDALARFKEARILVVGDVMLDQFVWGEVSRISPEAPVPVVEVERETMLLGGAANVANNLRALGAGCVLAGVVGDDRYGETVVELARGMGIDDSCLLKAERPTTLKTRIVARGQQVVRVDRESKRPLEASVMGQFLQVLEERLPACDAVIVSDYDKGVVSSKVMEILKAGCQTASIPLLVDPKPSNKALYHGVTLMTPNHRETEQLAGFSMEDDGDVERAARAIAGELGLDGLLVTRGARGMAVFSRQGLEDGYITFIPTAAREVFDVTGAGDTVISAVALGLASGLSLCLAAWLANLAAGLVVAKVGTATVSAQEMEAALLDRSDISPAQGCRTATRE